jgi:uncharacterized damage-inducible protein DinB
MADLLECLLQIKALRETPGRLQDLVGAIPAAQWDIRPAPETWAPLEVVAHLADVELVHGIRLRQVLSIERPLLVAVDPHALAVRARYRSWPLSVAFDRFKSRRAETLELLDTCRADELERVGVHPRRGAMTVADLVAFMLTHDIDHLGQIRERLGLLVPPTAAPQGEPA